MRSIRNQPFAWQEKKITRLLRKKYKENKSKMMKIIMLYTTITEIDSDFNNKDIKFYTKTISTYSGLSKDFIPKGLKHLEKLKIIKLTKERKGGKFKGKTIKFTPERIKEMPQKTVDGRTVNGQPVNGFLEPSEDSTLIEDSSLIEDSVGHPPKKPNPINSSFDSNSPLESKERKNSAKKKEKEKRDEEEFGCLWDVYGKKVGNKKKTFETWKKLISEDKIAVFKYLPAYKRNTPNRKFRKHLRTFLNDRTWEDEIIGENDNEEQKINVRILT